MRLEFHLLNVFTRAAGRLTGNPLCVVEHADDLDTELMQAIALQFNLSETTFVMRSTRASARVRIFTPDFEMRFAGHPTLGTAHVVRMAGASDALTLEMPAGIIPVRAQGDRWTLSANPARQREVDASAEELAHALGLAPSDLRWSREGARPLWVDTGSEQLIVPLASLEALQQRLAPRYAALAKLSRTPGRALAYAFAEHDDGRGVAARFFFEAGGALREDPATGSACANLGGWYLATGGRAPLHRRIGQGDAVRRPSTLELDIDAAGAIAVSGEVAHLGRGAIEL